MKAARLTILLVGVLFLVNLAFAGPQIAVADPGCTGAISLTSNNFTFTFDPAHPVLTFCNGTSGDSAQTWRSLNFSIEFGGGIVDLAGIYCGGPDASPHAVFDYCMVLDPNKDNQTSGVDPTFGQTIDAYLVHEFVALFGDGPSNFYSNPSTCAFNCDNSGGPPPADPQGSVELSFNLAPAGFEFASGQHGGTGLAPGDEFTIDLGCNQQNQSCQNWPTTTRFFGMTSTSQNTTTFPTIPTVPEPSTFMLLGLGIPVLLAKLRKRL